MKSVRISVFKLKGLHAGRARSILAWFYDKQQWTEAKLRGDLWRIKYDCLLTFEVAWFLQGLMDKPAEEDIRAAILRHEGKTDDFTKFTDAYKDTQPKPIFAEEEVDEYLEK